MRISYSAPAKIILSGEHASVYGKPTLITSINLRLTITIFRKMVIQKDKVMKMISGIVISYLKKNKINYQPHNYGFEIKSKIPVGSNLGSSAALSVASVAAFLEFYTGKEFDKEIINSLAYEVEKFFHGTPSGGDNSTSCFGGLIYFRKEFDFLKSISKLPIKFPESFSKYLFIIDSGKPKETTKEMNMMVRKLYTNNPKKLQVVFFSIEEITKTMVLSIQNNDIPSFKASILKNQKELEQLKVVSEKTKALLTQLNKYGAGKVTGAGGSVQGSGNVLFFSNSNQQTKLFLEKNKIDYLPFVTDSAGLIKI